MSLRLMAFCQILAFCIGSVAVPWAAAMPQHELQLELDLQNSVIHVTDQIHFESPRSWIEFELNKNLVPQSTPGVSLEVVNQYEAAERKKKWRATPPAETAHFLISYSGNPNLPEIQGQSDSVLHQDYLLLMDSSAWYPRLDESLAHFKVSTQLPSGWSFVSEGSLQSANLREAKFPGEGLTLIAAPFVVKEIRDGSRVFRTYFRKADNTLADQFLNGIKPIIERYERMIGPYPFSEMNVVENIYETGYGMAGFTLLGPQVMHFPFLMQSSFPHEILHNWWGNGVYVDSSDGNWCEGLTNYMADHFEQDLLGLGKNYRMKALMSYQDYAQSGQDFPLRQFQSRHDEATQAVGYSKSLMVFHMLRQTIGNSAFSKFLSEFFNQYKYQAAGFSQIQIVAEKVSGKKLDAFFRQWLDRTGAPELRLIGATKSLGPNGQTLVRVTLSQETSPTFQMEVPLVFQMKDGSSRRLTMMLTKPHEEAQFEFEQPPRHLWVDPDVDLLRLPLKSERPASLSELLGSPSADVLQTPDLANQNQFVTELGRASGSTYHYISSLGERQGRPLLVMGTSDLAVQTAKALSLPQNIDVQGSTLWVDGQSFDLAHHSFCFVFRDPQTDQAVVWIWAAPSMNPIEWASRLTHYGSFNALIFKDRPNLLKESWLPSKTPMETDL